MPSHLVTVAISVFLFIYIPLRISKNPKADWVGYFCKILGILLIGNELGWVIYKFNMVGGGWAEYMPFELCTINAYLLGFLLIFRPAYAVFEVVYFFSLAALSNVDIALFKNLEYISFRSIVLKKYLKS